jgi:peptidoglycan/xylan/chitin deacetylase (PgdA/CDA1 family)
MGIKAALRNSAARLLFAGGITAPERRGRGRFSIVTFHRVLPAEERRAYPFPGLVMTPQELDAVLAYLTVHFDCGTLEAQHRRFGSGEATTRPLLAITFDDAQHDNYLYARPLLATHKVKASFFAPVVAVEHQELLWHDRLGFAVLALLRQGEDGPELQRVLSDSGLATGGAAASVEGVVAASKALAPDARLRLVSGLEAASKSGRVPAFARLMTFGELAELAADGHEIGSHSMTHCMMPECDDASLAYELGESRRVLQARVGQPIESFCYPNGNSDARTAGAVARAGYRRAVTTTWGSNGPESDRFRFHRCDMDARRVADGSGKPMPAMIAFRMSGLYPGLG